MGKNTSEQSKNCFTEQRLLFQDSDAVGGGGSGEGMEEKDIVPQGAIADFDAKVIYDRYEKLKKHNQKLTLKKVIKKAVGKQRRGIWEVAVKAVETRGSLTDVQLEEMLYAMQSLDYIEQDFLDRLKGDVLSRELLKIKQEKRLKMFDLELGMQQPKVLNLTKDILIGIATIIVKQSEDISDWDKLKRFVKENNVNSFQSNFDESQKLAWENLKKVVYADSNHIKLQTYFKNIWEYEIYPSAHKANNQVFQPNHWVTKSRQHTYYIPQIKHVEKNEAGSEIIDSIKKHPVTFGVVAVLGGWALYELAGVVKNIFGKDSKGGKIATGTQVALLGGTALGVGALVAKMMGVDVTKYIKDFYSDVVAYLAESKAKDLADKALKKGGKIVKGAKETLIKEKNKLKLALNFEKINNKHRAKKGAQMLNQLATDCKLTPSIGIITWEDLVVSYDYKISDIENKKTFYQNILKAEHRDGTDSMDKIARTYSYLKTILASEVPLVDGDRDKGKTIQELINYQTNDTIEQVLKKINDKFGEKRNNILVRHNLKKASESKGENLSAEEKLNAELLKNYLNQYFGLKEDFALSLEEVAIINRYTVNEVLNKQFRGTDAQNINYNKIKNFITNQFIKTTYANKSTVLSKLGFNQKSQVGEVLVRFKNQNELPLIFVKAGLDASYLTKKLKFTNLSPLNLSLFENLTVHELLNDNDKYIHHRTDLIEFKELFIENIWNKNILNSEKKKVLLRDNMYWDTNTKISQIIKNLKDQYKEGILDENDQKLALDKKELSDKFAKFILDDIEANIYIYGENNTKIGKLSSDFISFYMDKKISFIRTNRGRVGLMVNGIRESLDNDDPSAVVSNNSDKRQLDILKIFITKPSVTSFMIAHRPPIEESATLYDLLKYIDDDDKWDDVKQNSTSQLLKALKTKTMKKNQAYFDKFKKSKEMTMTYKKDLLTRTKNLKENIDKTATEVEGSWEKLHRLWSDALDGAIDFDALPKDQNTINKYGDIYLLVSEAMRGNDRLEMRKKIGLLQKITLANKEQFVDKDIKTWKDAVERIKNTIKTSTNQDELENAITDLGRLEQEFYEIEMNILVARDKRAIDDQRAAWEGTLEGPKDIGQLVLAIFSIMPALTQWDKIVEYYIPEGRGEDLYHYGIYVFGSVYINSWILQTVDINTRVIGKRCYNPQFIYEQWVIGKWKRGKCELLMKKAEKILEAKGRLGKYKIKGYNFSKTYGRAIPFVSKAKAYFAKITKSPKGGKSWYDFMQAFKDKINVYTDESLGANAKKLATVDDLNNYNATHVTQVGSKGAEIKRGINSADNARLVMYNVDPDLERFNLEITEEMLNKLKETDLGKNLSSSRVNKTELRAWLATHNAPVEINDYEVVLKKGSVAGQAYSRTTKLNIRNYATFHFLETQGGSFITFCKDSGLKQSNINKLLTLIDSNADLLRIFQENIVNVASSFKGLSSKQVKLLFSFAELDPEVFKSLTTLVDKKPLAHQLLGNTKYSGIKRFVPGKGLTKGSRLKVYKDIIKRINTLELKKGSLPTRLSEMRGWMRTSEFLEELSKIRPLTMRSSGLRFSNGLAARAYLFLRGGGKGINSAEQMIKRLRNAGHVSRAFGYLFVGADIFAATHEYSKISAAKNFKQMFDSMNVNQRQELENYQTSIETELRNNENIKKLTQSEINTRWVALGSYAGSAGTQTYALMLGNASTGGSLLLAFAVVGVGMSVRANTLEIQKFDLLTKEHWQMLALSGEKGKNYIYDKMRELPTDNISWSEFFYNNFMDRGYLYGLPSKYFNEVVHERFDKGIEKLLDSHEQRLENQFDGLIGAALINELRRDTELSQYLYNTEESQKQINKLLNNIIVLRNQSKGWKQLINLKNKIEMLSKTGRNLSAGKRLSDVALIAQLTGKSNAEINNYLKKTAQELHAELEHNNELISSKKAELFKLQSAKSKPDKERFKAYFTIARNYVTMHILSQIEDYKKGSYENMKNRIEETIKEGLVYAKFHYYQDRAMETKKAITEMSDEEKIILQLTGVDLEKNNEFKITVDDREIDLMDWLKTFRQNPANMVKFHDQLLDKLNQQNPDIDRDKDNSTGELFEAILNNDFIKINKLWTLKSDEYRRSISLIESSSEILDLSTVKFKVIDNNLYAIKKDHPQDIYKYKSEETGSWIKVSDNEGIFVYINDNQDSFKKATSLVNWQTNDSKVQSLISDVKFIYKQGDVFYTKDNDIFMYNPENDKWKKTT